MDDHLFPPSKGANDHGTSVCVCVLLRVPFWGLFGKLRGFKPTVFLALILKSWEKLGRERQVGAAQNAGDGPPFSGI